eukprot:1184847-Pyramimonas_sp.AAC.1
MIERRWPAQLWTDTSTRAQVRLSSKIADFKDMVPLPPYADIDHAHIYTDATPGGYKHEGTRCETAWAFCALAVTTLGVYFIGYPAGPAPCWGVSDPRAWLRAELEAAIWAAVRLRQA